VEGSVSDISIYISIYYPGTCLEEMRENIQDSQSSGRNSTRTPTVYKSRAFPVTKRTPSLVKPLFTLHAHEFYFGEPGKSKRT
jgi:hypothetical protein